jgi:hypothetical protein
MLGRVCASILILVMATTTARTVRAHSGGTDENGCHTDSRTGDFHCHGSGGAGGGGPISIPGAILSLSGAISATIAIFVALGSYCPNTPSDQICWKKFGSWMWFGANSKAERARFDLEQIGFHQVRAPRPRSQSRCFE